MVNLLRNSWSRAALTAVFCALAVAGCAGKSKPKPKLAYEERPVELLYATGADMMDKRLWNQAVEYFGEVERQHPYSEWARRAILMQAFAHYEGNNYNEAIADADRYIQLYPGNDSAAYARYLKAVCYFEQIVDVGRDQAATGQALDNLRDVEQRYPNTEYARDAKLKIDMVNDQLAGKEMNVGRYYLRQGDTLAAIGRFKYVVDHYQTTSDTPEALYRLVEGYLTLGLNDEAKRNGAVLGFNYPGDPWYSDAYKLLTSNGLRPSVPPIAKERRGVFHKPLDHDKARTVRPPVQTTAQMLAAKHVADDSAQGPGSGTPVSAPPPPSTPPSTPPASHGWFHIPFIHHNDNPPAPAASDAQTPTSAATPQ
jgi:outer membrane protein assembly factor BamD